jgi:hypothetical protein
MYPSAAFQGVHDVDDDLILELKKVGSEVSQYAVEPRAMRLKNSAPASCNLTADRVCSAPGPAPRTTWLV